MSASDYSWLALYARRRGKIVTGCQKIGCEEITIFARRGQDFLFLVIPRRSAILASIDEKKAKIVELRYFGVLSIEETAEVMGVSLPTINRQWRTAKAWLYSQIAPG